MVYVEDIFGIEAFIVIYTSLFSEYMGTNLSMASQFDKVFP